MTTPHDHPTAPAERGRADLITYGYCTRCRMSITLTEAPNEWHRNPLYSCVCLHRHDAGHRLPPSWHLTAPLMEPREKNPR